MAVVCKDRERNPNPCFQGFEASDAGIFPCLLQNKKVASEKHQTFMEVEQARPQQKPGKLFSKETQ